MERVYRDSEKQEWPLYIPFYQVNKNHSAEGHLIRKEAPFLFLTRFQRRGLFIFGGDFDTLPRFSHLPYKTPTRPITWHSLQTYLMTFPALKALLQ